MITTIGTTHIASVVQSHLGTVASELRPDIFAALQAAHQLETCPQATKTLGQIIENAQLAAQSGVPLCQDTGTVWVLIEMGARAQVNLTGIQDALDAVVANSFNAAHLRASTVYDALNNRSNPGTNVPAFVEYVQHNVRGDASDFEVRIHTMLKGAGSDNASSIAMLPPGSDDEREAAITKLVLDMVRKAGSTACPPLVIGIGVGGTFDKVAGLSKRALLYPLAAEQTSYRNEMTMRLEGEILQKVNELDIGPAGLGGDITALAVHIETAPCHIASLPVAVNLSCHALRSRSTALTTWTSP